MSVYIASDEGGEIRIEAASLAAAVEAAEQWLRDVCNPQGATYWPECRVESEDGTEEDRARITVDPADPGCDQAEHSWHSPHDLVGGLAENPGVWGHGGGVIVEEVCRHCGLMRVTDTWAQDLDTGEQGLTSISYSEPYETEGY